MNRKIILFINTYQHRGGAASAAWRMFSALRDADYPVRHLSLYGRERSESVQYIFQENGLLHRVHLFIRAVLHLLMIIRFPQRRRVKFSYDYSVADVLRHEWVDESDMLFLHWVNDGFVSTDIAKEMAQKKTVLWFLHDMNPLTGGCHYSLGCTGYTSDCANCGILQVVDCKLSKKGFAKKKDINGISYIGASGWIENIFRRSELSRWNNFHRVPLFVEQALFTLHTGSAIKATFGLPTDSRIIGFGAVDGSKNEIKGGEVLRAALSIFGVMERSLSNIVLLTFGSQAHSIDVDGISTINVGFIADRSRLAQYYAAMDVYLNPSLAETFGQTTLESLQCGTPVVAFENTAATDLINHGKTGYLAKYASPEDFAVGISRCLQLGRVESADDFTAGNFVRQFSNILENHIL
jgi:glycosyltransferase involved in cell wall biosynthesis